MSCTLSCPNCGAILSMNVECRTNPLILDKPMDAKHALSRFKLSPRIRQTAELMLAGLPNKEIAAKLGVKLQVVKNYSHFIYDAVGCSSRSEFVSMVFLGGTEQSV